MRIARLAGLIVSFALAPVVTLQLHAAAAVAAAPDACATLTTAQVDAVLGIDAAPGAPVIPGHSETCVWTLKTDLMHKGKYASVILIQPLGARTPTQRFETGKVQVPNITKTPVPGVGDDAYFTTLRTAGTTLSVRKGQAAFEVHVGGFSDAEIQAKEKTLALQVLAKL